MCGICGKLVLNREGIIHEALIRDMATLIAHRGPDDHGFHFDRRIGLGHRRLSIVDLSGGHQPLSNEDDKVWIIFNGEIYNHMDLRPELEAKGHRYKTRSDTETILHAYEEYGVDCVRRLRGMFAFAIWDARDETLFMARDRFGIKPLYYRLGTASVSFASEMKSLLIDSECEATLDPVALYDYFTFKFIPGPNTPYREIKRLQPAHWMRVKGGETRIERYWHPEFRGISLASEEDHLAQLEQMLMASIRDHLMSEVPQGVFLSGGIDSSLITILMSRLIDEPVRTFSIAFEGHRGFDESRYARQVADVCRSQHQTFNCSAKSIESLPDVLWHIEEPLSDAAMIPLFTLCHEATKEVTVVHCGDGGDEAFGGYPRFFWDQYAATYGAIPENIRRGVLAPLFRLGQRIPGGIRELCRRAEKYSNFAGLGAAARYTNWFTLVPDEVKHQLLQPDFLRDVAAHRSSDVFEALFADAASLSLDSLGTKQYCELHSFIPDDLMLKSDKIAMSAGLEGRFPFLDHRLVEFGLSLPPQHKIARNLLKRPLRKLLERSMPRDFVYRRKQGFEVPVSQWFQGSLDRTLRETIEEGEPGGDAILNRGYLREMVNRLHAGDPVAGRQLFSVYVFLQWRKLFAHPEQICRERLRASVGAEIASRCLQQATPPPTAQRG